MTISLRLPDSLSRELDRLAEERKTTRSDLIREAVESYLTAVAEGDVPDRVALLTKLVTYEGSGRRDGGRRAKQHLKERFDAIRGRSSR